MDNYLCSAKLHTQYIHCINDLSNCLFISKIFNVIFYNYNRLEYSIISIVTCKISSAEVILIAQMNFIMFRLIFVNSHIVVNIYGNIKKN